MSEGLGICLSGGGYRATIFHVGALTRLNEVGVLARDDLTVTSVSGGSITAAFLATAFEWPLRSPVPANEWAARFIGPLRELTKKNIRTGAFLRSVLPGKNTVHEIAKRYDQALGTRGLERLPPQFVICATDLSFGVNWEFRGSGMGSYRTGRVAVPRGWTIGMAVAASSCFPPVFQPMRVSRSIGAWTHALKASEAEWEAGMSDLRLSDGGVYDNMGMEPVWPSDDRPPKHRFVLVSDAGGLFSAAPDEGLPRRVKRYQGVQESQVRGLRKRWLVARYRAEELHGAYWGIGSAPESYSKVPRAGEYGKRLAKDVIARIRTDLDAFSDAEDAVLQNHGYMLAEAALRTHCPGLISPGAPDADPPHPAWLPDGMDDGPIRRALDGSAKRKRLGRR